MRSLSIAAFLFLIAGVSHADTPDVLRLLKRDLGQSIEVVSKREIRYCPDNTCEIIKSQKPTNLLPEFLYLYLFHESGYVELGKSFNDQKPFREAAVESPKYLKWLKSFAQPQRKPPSAFFKACVQAWASNRVLVGTTKAISVTGAVKMRTSAKSSNTAVKALPSVAGTRRKRRAPYLKRYAAIDHPVAYDADNQ